MATASLARAPTMGPGQIPVTLPTVGPAVSVPPTFLRLPADACDFSRSQLALDFLVEAGYEFDDWQAFLIWWSEARRADGELAARDLYGEVARQNGKNIWLEGTQLVGLLLFGYTLFTHSAYRADTTHEHFVSLKERILDDPNGLLYEYVKKAPNQGFFNANGKEQIEFANGARLLFKTRSQQAGRGPRPQKLYFDEALILDPETVNSQAPSVSAQQGAQIFFASSAPLTTSEFQHALRDRAEIDDPSDGGFFAAMWNNPADIDHNDPEVWRRVNPSLGQGRMTEDSLNSNRKLMTLAGFVREHLGVADEPLTADGGPISLEEWDTLVESASRADRNRSVALAVSVDRKWATVGVAGRRTDGLYHVEWKTRKPGTGWIVEECVAIQKATGLPIGVHKTGPEAAFLPKLRDAGVEVEEIDTMFVGRATGQLIDAVREQTLRHLGQQTIRDALSSAAYRLTTDGVHIWSPTRSDGPIDALSAITVALGMAMGPEPETEEDFFCY